MVEACRLVPLGREPHGSPLLEHVAEANSSDVAKRQHARALLRVGPSTLEETRLSSRVADVSLVAEGWCPANDLDPTP